MNYNVELKKKSQCYVFLMLTEFKSNITANIYKFKIYIKSPVRPKQSHVHILFNNMFMHPKQEITIDTILYIYSYKMCKKVIKKFMLQHNSRINLGVYVELICEEELLLPELLVFCPLLVLG